MDKNQDYVQNVKIDEIPWQRLITAYGTASDFPQYFNEIWNMDSLDSVKKALTEILINIEHQSTLWHSTPFAMIFLARILEHAVFDGNSKEISDYIAETLLDFFELIIECYYDFRGETEEEEDALPCFSDMLKEEYLAPEPYDEEDIDDVSTCYEENENLFYSFWYYSYQTLLFSKPLLEKLKNTVFREEAEALIEML